MTGTPLAAKRFLRHFGWKHFIVADSVRGTIELWSNGVTPGGETWQNAVLMQIIELFYKQEQAKMPKLKSKSKPKRTNKPKADAASGSKAARQVRPKLRVGDTVKVVHDGSEYSAKLLEGSGHYWVNVNLRLPHSKVWRKTVNRWSRRDLFKKMDAYAKTITKDQSIKGNPTHEQLSA